MLDIGPILDPNGDQIQQLPERRSFVDTVRRLHIPYYEEARRYFSDALNEGWYSDQNEVSIFTPTTCESIIKRYET
jgi:hypothetical protein